MNRIALCALLSLFSFHRCTSAQSPHPDLVLQGKLTGAQNKTYFEVPFDVPTGVHRISVDFSYSGKEHNTTLDLGIADPERFRGNSGGNKSHFTLSETDATPSYLPGAIPAGKWRLLIAVPNIRPTEEAEYRAEVRFNSAIEDETFTLAPLATGKRWYRGDLHMHTAHSDGNCASQSGKRVPCPVFLTAQAAVAQNLDFIAITDHNTDSQYDAMRELQPFFDRLLLVPGREITTFWGHFNIFAVTQYIDYRAVAHASGQNGQKKWTSMGGALKANAGDSVSFRIHVVACPHAQIHVLEDGREAPGVAPLLTPVGDEIPEFKWTSDGLYHWLRCEVRDASGALILVSNPIYVNPTVH